MPADKFICPDKGLVYIDDCIKECRLKDILDTERCLSVRTLKAISEQREWKGVPSTTMLLRGCRENYLIIKEPYSVDPQSKIHTIFGSMVHGQLEKHTPENSESEIRLYDEISSGAFDFYQDGILYDDKTYGSFSVVKTLGIYSEKVPDGVYKTNKTGKYKIGDTKYKSVFKRDGLRHRLDLGIQLNDYRMKLEIHGMPVRKMICEMLIRDGGSYIAKGRGIHENAILTVVNKISDCWIKRFMTKKWNDLNFCLKHNILPPVCRPRERWYDSKSGISSKCLNFCDVRHICDFGMKEIRINKGVD